MESKEYAINLLNWFVIIFIVKLKGTRSTQTFIQKNKAFQSNAKLFAFQQIMLLNKFEHVLLIGYCTGRCQDPAPGAWPFTGNPMNRITEKHD